MQRAILDPWVAHALSLVQKRGICEANLRSNLNALFRNHLGPNPEHPGWTVAQVVQGAISDLGCQPMFDPALLDLSWPEIPAS